MIDNGVENELGKWDLEVVAVVEESAVSGRGSHGDLTTPRFSGVKQSPSISFVLSTICNSEYLFVKT